MRKCFLWLLVFLPTALFSAELKIGYIDSKRIFDEYEGRDKIAQELQKKVEDWEKEALAREQEIQSLIQEFESQSLMLSEEARARKRAEIEKKQQEYQQFVQSIYGPEGKAKQLNDEIMRPFIDKINVILQEIGKEENYIMIFDVASTGVVYAAEGLELTERVIAELNREFAPPPPVVEEIEKTYFCVLKFKELTAEARDFEHGRQIANYLRAAIIQKEEFEEVQLAKFSQAIIEANIDKKEEDYLPEEAARVGRLAGADIIIIGEVTRVGEKVDITCKVIDPNTGSIIVQESGSTLKAEWEDIRDMIGEVTSKLIQKITP